MLPDPLDSDELFSIHASAKEATNKERECIWGYEFSIHASAKEATQSGTKPYKRNSFSIHASAKEATLTHTRDIIST